MPQNAHFVKDPPTTLLHDSNDALPPCSLGRKIIYDVQKNDQHTVIADPGQTLAEGSHAIGVVAFQVV